MNDGIDPAYSSLSYASVDNAVSVALKLGIATELIQN